MPLCFECKFNECNIDSFPCSECGTIGNGKFVKFVPMDKTPVNPPVTPPKEEINHPDRYKTGGVECIDVMLKIFGVDAVKSFCKLNAFKYIWREQRKNGVEDLKKCAWYLDKLIELTERENNG